MHPSVAYILFDLDNTLYSSCWGLEQNVSRRINEYIARSFGMSMEDAWALRKERIRACNYGTTLEWLRAEKGLSGDETERYFACIHPEDEADALKPDPQLRPLLVSFKLPMGILTNSPMEHVLRILSKLGILDLFPSIFDIRGNGFTGKPDQQVYRRVLEKLALNAQSCLFVDDTARHVEAFNAMGGRGVYYDEQNRHPAFSGQRITELAGLRDFLSP